MSFGTKANPETSTCLANQVNRRKCPVITESYSNCHLCPYASFRVNLGKSGLRGGVESLPDLLKWRRKKQELGIPHGDGE